MTDLDGQLERLQAAQLVRRTEDQDPSYNFRHALAQETTYESLLLKKRREVHRLVARAYEQLYMDGLDELASSLARHWSEAGDDAKTLEWATRAGDAAARLYANTEATAFYSLALAAADRTNAPVAVLRDLYAKRGRACELRSRFGDALANYDEMEAAGGRRGDRQLELAARLARATLWAIPGSARDPEQARRQANDTLPLARELGDRAAEAKIYWILLLSNVYWGGNNEEAIQNGRQSLAIAQEAHLVEQMAFSYQDLSVAYLYAGNMDQSREARMQAAPLWRELGNRPMLAENITGMGILHYMLGEYREALAVAREGNEISRQIGNLNGQGFAGVVSAVAQIQLGEYGDALRSLEDATPIIELGGLEGNGASVLGLEAWIDACMGQGDRARELMRGAVGRGSAEFPLQRLYLYSLSTRIELLCGNLPEARRVAEEGEVRPDPRQLEGLFPPVAAIGYLAASELALANADNQLAIAILDQLLAHLESRGRLADRSHALWLRGRALAALGQADEAMAEWQQARNLAEKQGERPVLWRILASIADAQRRLGGIDSAQQLTEQAREVIGFLASQIPPEYRESFLRRPEVQRVVNGD